jgi:hypothetical protein
MKNKYGSPFPREKLTYPLIKAAVNNDAEALNTIIGIYDRYITRLATFYIPDSKNNLHPYVDEDLKSRLRTKLIASARSFKLT